MFYDIFLDFKEKIIYSKRFDSVTLLLGVIVLVLITHALKAKRNGKLPPGPVGLPIFGYYLFLRKKPIETISELAEKYGNVFGLYVGSQYLVLLNDWEALKDGLGQNATLDRPAFLYEKVPYKFGTAGANGAEWVAVRRLASRVLKDGLHRNNWEDIIEKELSDLIQHITKQNQKPIEVRSFFQGSFANNVISLILGKRLDVGHPITKTISKSVEFLVEAIPVFKLSNFSERISWFLTALGMEEDPPVAKNTKEMFKYVSETVDSNVDNRNPEVSNSFFSRFQAEIDDHKKNTDKNFITENSLKGTVIGMMVAGSETTRTSMIWALIAMADHPDKQKKVHEELDRVIGKKGDIRWSERSKVPYTMATLLESMRWKPTFPFNLMRTANKDTQIQGYHIPKGTFVLSNTWCIHNDPRYWENPDQFIPERFLQEDGRKVNMAPESYNPFSYGKRNCIGKLLASMNMLQYFSALMHKFTVVPKEGSKVKYDAVLSMSYQARNVELRFIPR